MAYGNVAVNSPYKRCVAITASDANPIATGPTDALLVATSGNATCLDESANQFVLTAVPAGAVIPIHTSRVNATGLTAVLYALYLK